MVFLPPEKGGYKGVDKYEKLNAHISLGQTSTEF
jgi:hypothetical protein